MCEACFTVAARMSTCRGCRNAWYCSTACQRAAWASGHKQKCRGVVATLAALGFKPAPGIFQFPSCIGSLLQVRSVHSMPRQFSLPHSVCPLAAHS